MRWRYRAEPGREVLLLEDMPLGSRLPRDQGRFMILDVGRDRVIVPVSLDWNMQDAFAPVKVIFDPRGRVWTPVQWTDTGRTAELSTPFPKGD